MTKSRRGKQVKVGILGFGREGKSVLRYLRRSSQFKKARIEILDYKKNKNYLKGLARFDLIFRSPGIPYNLPELKKAREDGVYFSSVTRLFFENFKGKIIGVTGTKGKGTTSTLLYQILKAEGKNKVFLAGNIGRPAIDAMVKCPGCLVAVLEFSSFQLHDLDMSPQIAVMLDVFPDHQDAHETLKEYYEAKANVAKFQKKSDVIFYFTDNAKSKELAKMSPAKKISVDYRKFKMFRPQDLQIKGLHNFRNAVMAASVASYLKVSADDIKRTVLKFRGLEHRLEYIGQKNEVNFFNDSASTNPDTSAAAVASFPKKSQVLIVGGLDKNLDYSILKKAVKKHEPALVVLMGENRNKIKLSLKGAGVKLKVVSSLASAVKDAYEAARKIKGERNVIFSPGAASFDMFKDYADRGRKFKKLVTNLTK